MAMLGFIGVPISYLVLALIAAGARFMLSREPPTIKLLLGTMLWSLLIVLASYEFIADKYGTSKGVVQLLIALGAFAAKDILEILIKLLEQIRVDPLGLLRDLLNKYRPGSSDGDNSK